ncbi:RCC1 domain-containing protein [Desulfatiglans anilini]|uniref:RCC1 domain-containing protein n=1 Tax=Desulfatiglans anilini TaxID=90728 RepID=UPI001FC99A9E|nr:hypothetical protein [Desulfatiglans anilini]
MGRKSDGTVVAVGNNDENQCDVSSWTDMDRVWAGSYTTIGMKSNGNLLAVGHDYYGQCNVSTWSAITEVAPGYNHTIGLKSDRTVVAVGYNEYGQCDLSSWKGIVQVGAGYYHSVGLKSDGTVLAVGYSNYGQCNVSSWSGITQIAAGYLHTVGLKSDGTVVAVGLNNHGQCALSSWTGIVQVSAGYLHTVGLKFDGTVMAAGNNSWDQCNVDTWDLGDEEDPAPPGWQPAYGRLFKEPSALTLFRRYRDGILADSAKGRFYTLLLYEHSQEALLILLKNPHLMAEAKFLLDVNRDAVEAALSSEEAIVYHTTEIDLFLGEFASKASPGLSLLATAVRHELRREQAQGRKFFGLTLR